MFSVLFHAYCGMTTPIATATDLETAKTCVRGMLRRAKRRGQPVHRLDRRSWEFQTRDDAGSIGDQDGILAVTRCRRNRNDY